jgi:hypothetical protein
MIGFRVQMPPNALDSTQVLSGFLRLGLFRYGEAPVVSTSFAQRHFSLQGRDKCLQERSAL